MQTTLLGLGIALIAALLAALIGPVFIDWSQYRATFEAQASRILDQPVRLGGAIDVRLLPSPSIAMRDIEVGPRATPAFGAQSVRVELSLGALVRGEWRAATLEIGAPEINVSLDPNGQLTNPIFGANIERDSISVDRLTMSDGRLLFEDLAGGATLALTNVSFSGEIRSVFGPIKGEGMFATSHGAFKYSLATARATDSGAGMRLTIDPADQPLTFQAEGNFSLNERTPSFEGAITLVRPAGVILSTGKALAGDPWRLSGKFKGDPRRALVEQIEAQYGPDDRSIRLTGVAKIAFGAGARLEAVFSARQVDLDRALSASAMPDRLPHAVLRRLFETGTGAWRPPVPFVVGFGIDAVTFGGGTLQSVRGDISYSENSWSVDSLDFRAPGATRVTLSGRTGGVPDLSQFTGLFDLEAADPGALMTWLEGADRSNTALGALRLRGEMALGQERVTIDRVQGELGRKPFQARIDYAFAGADQRPRLDASISAAEFDLDGAIALVRAAGGGGSNFSWPGDFALAIDLGRTRVGGVAAVSTKAKIRFDAAGLNIERLSIAELGGAAIDASGRIDTSGAQPNGSIKVVVDAQKIDGVATLITQFWPTIGETLRGHAAILSPAKLAGSLSIDAPSGRASTTPGAGASASSDRGSLAIGKLAVNGTLGALNVSISGDAVGKLTAAMEAMLRVEARIASPDASLLTLTGIDRVFAVGKRPAVLTLTASGPASGDIGISGGLSGEGLDATARGTFRLADARPNAALSISLAASDMHGLRRGAAPLPVAIKSNAQITGGVIAFEEIAGSIGETPVRGNVSVALAPVARIDGRLSADVVDFSALIAAAAGAPPSVQRGWSPHSFAVPLLSGWTGRIELAAAQGAIAPAVTVRNLQATVDIAPSALVFSNVAGKVGRGNISAHLNVSRAATDVTARGSVTIVNADAHLLVAGKNSAPVNGSISSQFDFEGSGSNPAALFGSMRGGGSITLENGQIAGFDAKAIDVAIRAVERGTPIASPRLADIVANVMDNGTLSVPWATLPFEISSGRLRFGKLVTSQATADLELAGSIDLVEQTMDTRVTINGAASRGAGLQRPEIAVRISGPIAAPRWSHDVTGLVSWLTLQAVDRETKRLEAEEREAKRREALEAAIREMEQQRRDRQQTESQSSDGQANVPSASGAVQTGTVPQPLMPPPPGGPARGAPRTSIQSAPLPPLQQ